ncbi:glycosyltransferase involved in cell wall biosynthesis [Krasilnikovia cinnamomea]|uniref:Glycosyltransferase involved in cell wall biosynthesis n=1 Tax=Krasilnikovia cinnamomea TaxID=349313 RepID=A0A4Q7ZI42_9ACTN|nr:glycosyltransferase [Krasilnikovia cinnamomea]RZU49769.1 glycosyltransferase involved in cell wall biosynthesis [Krasilnikovia cinnamomea]
MPARRVKDLARRVPRRVRYGALGCVLVAGLATAAATRSWLVLIVELFVVAAILGSALWEQRQLRMALGRQAKRLRATTERVRDSDRVQAHLALELYDQNRAAGREFPAALGPLVLDALAERGDVLPAFALAERSAADAIAVPTFRRLRRDLHRSGYLARAEAMARHCAERGKPDDRRAVIHLRGEHAVLSGDFVPSVAPRDPGKPVPNRVLHLVGKSLPEAQAGYTLRTHFIATAQQAAGLDPHVATELGFGADTDAVVDGITYHRVQGPAQGTLPLDQWLSQHVERTAELVRQLRPAVLHPASNYLNALTALAIGKAYGIPVVYETRGFWEETWLSRQIQRAGWDYPEVVAKYGEPDIYRMRRDLEDRCRREADRVVTLADVMADRIVLGGVPRDRIHVVPNAVDTDRFPVLSRDADLAQRLGIPADTTVVGYISSLAEYEGIDTLLRAYARLDGRVALLIVGDGVERENLQQLAADLGASGVHFTGQVPHDQVLRYYSLIDVFVVPRRPTEVCHLVTPLKPFEAFATGRAVVLSDVRALAGIARESGAAELFTAGDPGSLVTVLRRLLADPDRRRELAEAGAAWVRQERTWSANARLYARLYEELTSGVPGQRRPERSDAVVS